METTQKQLKKIPSNIKSSNPVYKVPKIFIVKKRMVLSNGADYVIYKTLKLDNVKCTFCGRRHYYLKGAKVKIKDFVCEECNRVKNNLRSEVRASEYRKETKKYFGVINPKNVAKYLKIKKILKSKEIKI